ncbi:MAG: F0F1 ATP synthase subunit epsilon [Elusimicrobia bacterium]|nr:F0F1 ATP synthase subunit epsilon [Candidatus Obscuribacterium magneticum]MCB4756368.1 F0F1 ATP synthase subunit epsilon [Candidatus Obscuribacterium magneticum]
MSIKVDLITPERPVLSETVEFIAAPAVDGEIGVLPHHTPLLTQLGPGEIRLKKSDGETHFVISGGFLEVQEGSVVQIFAETAEMEADIDEERARQAAERAKNQLKSSRALNEQDLITAEAALRRAVARLHVAQGRKRPLPKKEIR